MKRNLLPLLAIAIMIVSCQRENASSAGEEIQGAKEATSESASPYVPGVANVKFSDEMIALVEENLDSGKIATKSMELNQVLDELGIKSMTRTFPYAGEYEGRTRREGLHKWYTIEYDTDKPLTKAVSELSGIEGVEKVCPRRRIAPDAYFNDKYFSVQWGIENTSYPGSDINVVDVWRHYTTGSPDVIVAVVDQGIDFTHPDLADNCLTGDEGSYNFCDNSTDIVPGFHGIHVGGIIAAVGNNEIGVAGVAGGDYAKGKSGVKLLSCQIFKDKATGDHCAAIKWAADHGAVICNNSWGYYYDSDEDGVISEKELEKALNDSLSDDEKAAIDYFVKYAGCDDDGNQKPDSPMKGGLILFASGNEGLEVGLPASYESAVAVGAIDKDGKVADYANHGDWVDIAAPGTDIASTYLNGGWVYMTGTSMACPFVSGAAALLVSYYGGQGFTCDDLREKLIKGANYDHFDDNTVVGPLLDVLGAFTYGSTATPSSVDDFTAETQSNNIDLGWNVTADENGIPSYGTLVVYSKDKSAVAGTDPANPGSNVAAVKFETGDLYAGDSQSETITGLEFETTYFVAVAPYSYNGNYASLSQVKSVKTGGNNPPVISTEDETSGLRLTASDKVILNFSITEPDGHDFTVGYANGSTADTWANTIDGKGYVLTINGAGADEGTYSATITATDEYGLASTYMVNYIIRENQAPVISSSIENIIIYGLEQTVELDLGSYFSDPDGDTISYSLTSSADGTVHTSISSSKLYLTSLGYGVVEITVTAADPRKASASQTFKVLVRQKGVEMSCYPNPVTTTLYVGTGEEDASTDLRVVSLTGSVVYRQTKTVSAFNPATIDMSGVAPGRYTVVAKWNGVEHSLQIVKQ